jgi:hypothetical protein
MVPPPQQPVAAPPPHKPNNIPMYHPHQLNQQQHQHQRQHLNGYQQSYPPSQAVGMNRYGPPPMMHQQHNRVHHYQNQPVAPNSYHHLPAPHASTGRHPRIGSHGHHHFIPHPAVMVPGASHSMGQLPSQHHPRQQYPPRSFQIPPHQAIHPYHQPHQYLTIDGGMKLANETISEDSAGSSVVAPKEERNPISNSDASVVTEKISGEDMSAKGIKGIVDLDVQQNCETTSVVNKPSTTSLSIVSFKDCSCDVNVNASSKNLPVPDEPTRAVTKENRNSITVMSPITMCFERMLGAGKYLFALNLDTKIYIFMIYTKIFCK